MQPAANPSPLCLPHHAQLAHLFGQLGQADGLRLTLACKDPLEAHACFLNQADTTR